ncbi:unnamed protein product [Sphagnum balticum]
MYSSSVVSTSDSSSSNEGTSAHTQAEVSHSPHGPPRQLCQCTKCVGQISQKSYVCAQHIQQFGRHRGLTPGASSSHVGLVPLMRLVSHIMRKGHVCPPLGNDPKHNVQVRVMLGLLLRAYGVCVSSLANVPILSSHGTLQFLGYFIVCPMMRRLWFGVDDGLLRPLHLERGMAMEYMLVRTSL